MPDPLPSDLMLAGKLRIRVQPGKAVLRMAVAPKMVASGLLEIPERYRDQPLEGLVVAVGPGKPFDERYCKGLERRDGCVGGKCGTYEACGQLAVAVALDLGGAGGLRQKAKEAGIDPAVTDLVIKMNRHPSPPRRYLCADHASNAHQDPDRFTLIRPLLKNRPAEVAVGDRVVTTAYAKRANTTTIFGEDLVITDDLLAIIDPAAGMAIRGSAL